MGPSKALGGALTVYSQAIHFNLKSTPVIRVFVYIGNIHIFINVNVYIFTLYIYVYILQLVKTKRSSTLILHEEAIRVNNH